MWLYDEENKITKKVISLKIKVTVQEFLRWQKDAKETESQTIHFKD